jgi:antitoxin (DNA-binding transcriptional repressor) of toxin-antitoxin stability system
MRRANIHDLKTHLSRYLAELDAGEVLVVCKNNEPVAELRALPKRLPRRRPWGTDHGLFTVPADINAPLTDDELSLWER